MCSMANTTCCTWIDTSGKVDTQLHKITEQATWLKKMTPSARSSLTYLTLIGLGLRNHSPKCTPDTGDYPAYL